MGFCIAEDINLNILLGKGGAGLPTLPNTKNHIVKGALVAPNGKHYFFTDKRYFRSSESNGLEKIANIQDNWTRIPNNIDGAFVHPTNKKAYFFKGDKYNRWDFKNGNDNNELAISRFWKGVPNNIDAVTNHTNGKVYFFKDDKYHRYDTKLKKVDKVDLISKNWKGVPNNVSAAFLQKNGRVYFFKDKDSVPGYVNYFRFDIKLNKVDKVGYVGIDGWKDLDFKKKSFVKKIENKKLKITLTKMVMLRSDAKHSKMDVLFQQSMTYRSGNKYILDDPKKRYFKKFGVDTYKKNEDFSKNNRHGARSLIYPEWEPIRESTNAGSYTLIGNSLVYPISDKDFSDSNAYIDFLTSLSGFYLIDKGGLSDNIVISKQDRVVLKINEVLKYLLNPKSVPSNYFSRDAYHYSGAEGDFMPFKISNNVNSLDGYIENSNQGVTIRAYYNFELIP